MKTVISAKVDVTLVRELERLSRESGATRHAALVAALKKGIPQVTADELKATLPAYRR